MTGSDKPELLLGKQTPVCDSYAPQLLFPIPRAAGRERLSATGSAFFGEDLWHLYELSWLDQQDKPQVRVGRLRVPASSPNMVESKSLKLYLNSLNNTRFASEAEFRQTVSRDLAVVVGSAVTLELLDITDPKLAGKCPPGDCLDQLPIERSQSEPDAGLLQIADQTGEMQVYSHLLRSLCPVTGQPDWATVWLHFRGGLPESSSLLRYIVAYRGHQEFHEQCVERIFCDIRSRCAPEFLHVQAFYTRRGGLDINPFRSTDPAAQPLARMNRQ